MTAALSLRMDRGARSSAVGGIQTEVSPLTTLRTARVVASGW